MSNEISENLKLELDSLITDFKQNVKKKLEYYSLDCQGECLLNVRNQKDGKNICLKQKLPDQMETYFDNNDNKNEKLPVTLFSIGFSSKPQLIHFKNNQIHKIDYNADEINVPNIEAAINEKNFKNSSNKKDSTIQHSKKTKVAKRKGSSNEGFTWYECPTIEDCEEQLKQYCKANGFRFKIESEEILEQGN